MPSRFPTASVSLSAHDGLTVFRFYFMVIEILFDAVDHVVDLVRLQHAFV